MKTGVKRRTDTSSAEILGQIPHLGKSKQKWKDGFVTPNLFKSKSMFPLSTSELVKKKKREKRKKKRR